MAQYEVKVAGMRQLTPSIRELVLRSADGAALPGYAPGAHIEIEIPRADGARESRAYSLIGGTAEADDPSDTYRIAVEHRADGHGGSHFLGNAAEIGTLLGILAPRNDFPLETHPANRLLIAGGIGIAPIYAMARRLTRLNLAFDLVHVVRDANQMAFRSEIEALAPSRVTLHVESPEGAPLEVTPLIAKLAYPAEVYVCASYALNRAVTGAAGARGLSRLQIHEQCFAPPPVIVQENTPFEVLLRRSGLEFQVPADASILETMLANGHTPKFYCGRGECGICPMPIVSADGPIEHRDHVLSAEEKAQNKRFCICVSRVKGTRLVLDA